MPEPLPPRIGRYEIQGELGRGMMGVVYLARDPELGRTVALKTVSLTFAVSDEDREAFDKRFLEEARIAARLSHPGIVVVHDVGRDGESGTLYIALEHLKGRTLAELAGGGRSVPWRDALRVTARVARALQHAHGQGIVHRDIKPANIMVLDSGEAKVLDFGVAKAPASQLTAPGQFFGTPAYMSPEQVGSQPLDGRSDVFSLGCVLYLALTGRRPFDGDSVPVILSRVLHDAPAAPSRVAPGVPVAVDAVIARTLAKEPAGRYPDAGALADDLEAVLDGRPTTAAAAPAPGDRTMVSARRGAAEPSAARRQPPSPAVSRSPAAAGKRAVSGRVVSGRGRRWALAAAGLAVLATGTWLAGPRLPAPGAPGQERPAADSETGAEAATRSGRSWFGREEPARLAVDFDHHLKSGTLEVWVDDALVLEEPIEGRVTQKILSFRLRKGSVQETLEVAPGMHEVRVQVSWDGRRRSASLSGHFKSGVTRRLEVSVGRLTREVTLEWR